MDFNKIKRLLSDRESGIIGEAQAFKSAVLIPLVKIQGEWSILFEVRSLFLKSQPGDICFPGGHIEPHDETPMETAIRETCEELGLEEKHIEVLGPLDKFVPSSEFILYPYIGVIHSLEDLNIEEQEVAEIFTVPLSWLLTHEPETHIVEAEMKPGEDFPYDNIPGGRNYKWRTRHIVELFYNYDNHSIWGMTARILQHFLSIIK